MAGSPRVATKTFGHGSVERALTQEHNKVVTDLDALRRVLYEVLRDQIVPAATAAGLSIDATAPDIETDNAVVVQYNGRRFNFAAVSALDISAAGACAGDTITISTKGIGFVFAKPGGLDIETPATPQALTTDIAAWASWQTGVAAGRLPLAGAPLGAVLVTEGGSGTFTWGTTGLTTIGAFTDFNGIPAVESAAASLAIGATTTAVTYGAGVCRLGSGTRVSYTGKANVAITGSDVADARTGAFLLLVLADDSETFVQLGADYANLVAAREAVRDHIRNPMLAHIGTLYVTNGTGAAFVPGTTALDLPGVTATLDIEQPVTASVNSEADLTAATINA